MELRELKGRFVVWATAVVGSGDGCPFVWRLSPAQGAIYGVDMLLVYANIDACVELTVWSRLESLEGSSMSVFATWAWSLCA